MATAFVLFNGRESTVSLGLNPDGAVNLITGSTDTSGARTAIAMQAAETLGIPVEDVVASVAGTSSIGSAEVTHGSRTTYATD